VAERSGAPRSEPQAKLTQKRREKRLVVLVPLEAASPDAPVVRASAPIRPKARRLDAPQQLAARPPE